MLTFARFVIVFVLALVMTHTGGWHRFVFLSVFAAVLCELLWRGLRPERDAERSK